MARVACKPEAPRTVDASDATTQDFNIFDNMDIRGTVGRECVSTQQAPCPDAPTAKAAMVPRAP
ncbi:hypothetical protein [Xanthomonas arboricola]|uniref:hypothetical protein n=1 Tax=Xanthomonas arboricola TaxID=56448 RepID=UPI00187B54CC|nr:hypothetical protein [Xanthomonas arboricola]